ncbi:hypothetical protein EDC94DRAFT_616199 [Helicostylum pulchrum]|nr:hypothetical protein EDC94DRAFT_616199 [Helicostylum pulchrum]
MSTDTTAVKKSNNDNNKQTENRMRSSTKRPRAPIACFRCHHKKVRCDGAHPNCTRCLTTGVLCAYPSSRRSRTTQPTNVDPFIDNLSHLEARIRRIETDLESQRSMVHSIVSPSKLNDETANELSSKILKTEIEVQDSRSILAQLRLRGEQRISRGKRAAAAAAAAAATSSSSATTQASPLPKEEKLKNNRQTKPCNKLPKKPSANKPLNRSPSDSSQKTVTNENKHIYQPSSFYFQGMMLDNNTDINAYDHVPPGHGMDWTLFDQHQQDQPNEFLTSSTDGMQNLFTNAPAGHLMFPDKLIDASPVSTRSSSLASNLGFPVNLQPSNSTTSTTSNATSATSCSSLNSCDNLFGFAMEDMMIHSSESQGNFFFSL